MGEVDTVVGALADATPTERLGEIEARRADLAQMRTQVEVLRSEVRDALAVTSRMIDCILSG